jgi:hypothetical protein
MARSCARTASLNLVVKGSAASPAAIDLWVERLALHVAR